MRALLASLLMLVPASALACPPVTMTSVSLQDGMYRDACDMPADTRTDYCVCKGQVTYPVLSSPVADLSAVNDDIRAQAEQSRCAGEAGATSEKIINEHQFSYEVVYNQHPVLTLALKYYNYPAGAAHGMYATDYVVIEKMSGKKLGYRDFIDTAKLDDLNGYIHHQLAANPDTFLGNGNADYAMSKGDVNYAYFTPTGCESCSIGVDAKGVFVLFGLYSIAPYSSGEVRVDIPGEFVPDNSLQYLYKPKDA